MFADDATWCSDVIRSRGRAPSRTTPPPASLIPARRPCNGPRDRRPVQRRYEAAGMTVEVMWHAGEAAGLSPLEGRPNCQNHRVGHTYNHLRPHQALDIATPASLFRPNPQPEPVKVVSAQGSEAVPVPAESAPPALVLAPSVGAVEAGASPAWPAVRTNASHRRLGPPGRSPPLWTAPHQAGLGPGRQGVLLPRDPRAPTQTRHPRGDPGTGRPAGQLAATRTSGRQTAGLRPRGIQATQHRRAVHQPPEAVARHRHPLREDRDHLPRRTSHRRHLPVVRR